MISFWNRLTCSTKNKLSTQIYNFILNDIGHGYKWLSYIASIFNNTGNHKHAHFMLELTKQDKPPPPKKKKKKQ